jgi:hypothetical protein
MATTYKIDGAKFSDMDTLKEALWNLYKDSMTEEEFDEYVKTNVEEIVK